MHYAGLNDHNKMVEFLLERGADSNILDQKISQPPGGWAAHGGHLELRDYLEQAARRNASST